MTEAPASPNTAELRDEYGIELSTQLAVLETADAVSLKLKGPDGGLVAIIGGCAMTGDKFAVEYEGRRIANFSAEYVEHGPTVLHRTPPWKPRTNPDSWHGEETSNPAGAYQTLARLATDNANVAIELASQAHIARYGPMVSFGWIGSRKVEDNRLVRMLAIRDPKLPLGIKNGIDGKIETALESVSMVNEIRSNVSDAAPAILIYRGGQNAVTPEDWQAMYRRALDMTEGRLIVDVAHGSEMAHDPARQFNKSMAGQMLAMEAVINVADRGELPAGIMIEASDIQIDDPRHITDPNIPLSVAFDGIDQLNSRKIGRVKINSEEKVSREDFTDKVVRVSALIENAQNTARRMLHPQNALY